jgi:hypothetical protein
MTEEWVGPCRSCGKPFGEHAKPDANGWCAACRGRIVRGSTRLAVVPAVVVFLLLFWLITWSGLLESRFMVVWLALDVAVAFVAFKIARRIAFDVLRARATSRSVTL